MWSPNYISNCYQHFKYYVTTTLLTMEALGMWLTTCYVNHCDSER